jgi:hypothetical protein
VLLGLAVPAIAVAVAIAAFAGAGIPVNTGPLGPVGERVCNVARMPHDQILAFGLGTALFNSGSSPAKIERVTLYQPRHLRLLGAVVLRNHADDSPVGLVNGWPPDLKGTGLNWSARVPAAGATIGPATHENLLLELRPAGPVATAAGVSVTYTEAGQQYRLIPHSSKLAMFVGSHGTCSP